MGQKTKGNFHLAADVVSLIMLIVCIATLGICIVKLQSAKRNIAEDLHSYNQRIEELERNVELLRIKFYRYHSEEKGQVIRFED